MGTVAIHTHGCKLNQADTDLLARRFAEAGYRRVDAVAEADVYVLNTCTVTAAADAKARQALRAARRANPEAFVVAAGCYAQRAAADLQELDGVSLVVGNSQKDHLVSLVLAALHGEGHGATDQPLHHHPTSSPLVINGSLAQGKGRQPRRTRAMIKIQEGCDQVCAYCIVPKVRGRERSISPDTLVQQVDQRVAEGFQEVVLTGTQLGSYGFDLPGTSLSQLLRRILDHTGVARLRVSSLQAQEIGPELLELWGDSRLCPHFHVPLQSGSDRILERMRRRYQTNQFASTVESIRWEIPEAAITTDLIVGFPGEGEQEFRESRDFSEAIGFSDIHVFPFSPRPGTSAARFTGQVPEAVKKERTAVMLAVAERHFRAFRTRQLGQTRPVLWESAREGSGARMFSGLTDNYIRVTTGPSGAGADLSNRITRTRLVELMDDLVYAQPL